MPPILGRAADRHGSCCGRPPGIDCADYYKGKKAQRYHEERQWKREQERVESYRDGMDPEPDRTEAASRPSPEWERAAAVMPLLERVETILDALGCKANLHEWTYVYNGDPPGPNRRLSWDPTRVRCQDCGQTAALMLDAPPDVGD